MGAHTASAIRLTRMSALRPERLIYGDTLRSQYDGVIEGITCGFIGEVHCSKAVFAADKVGHNFYYSLAKPDKL